MTNPHPNFFFTLSHLRRVAFAALAVALVGCSALDGTSNAIIGAVSPYRPEIVQGNVVTKEQVALLKPGLSRAQVRQILGTPLVTSMFHENRWDYVFTINRQGLASQQRKLTLIFKADVLQTFSGDEMPSANEFINSITKADSLPQPKTLKASAEELERARQDNPVEITQSPTLPAAPKIYPPLESGVAR